MLVEARGDVVAQQVGDLAEVRRRGEDAVVAHLQEDRFDLGEVALADHQALTQASVSALVNPQQTLLMTEKDAVKCRGFAEANWWYLPVDAIMTDERAQQLLTELVTLAQR